MGIEKLLSAFFMLSVMLLLCQEAAQAQSAVYVYKNTAKAEGDYMCMRGLPTIEEAEFMTQQKLVELVNDEANISKLVSTDKKGFGMVLRGILTLPDGRTMAIFGAALGCSSAKEAEAKALENMKAFNPEWKSATYRIAYQFKD